MCIDENMPLLTLDFLAAERGPAQDRVDQRKPSGGPVRKRHHEGRAARGADGRFCQLEQCRCLARARRGDDHQIVQHAERLSDDPEF